MHDSETSQVKVEHDRTELIMIRSDGYAGFSREKEKKIRGCCCLNKSSWWNEMIRTRGM